LVQHQGSHRHLVHQSDHRVPERRTDQAGAGRPLRRQRQPRAHHPGLLGRRPLRHWRARERCRRGELDPSGRPDLRVRQLARPPQADRAGRAGYAGGNRRQSDCAAELARQRDGPVERRAGTGEEGDREVAVRLGEGRGLHSAGPARYGDRAHCAERSAGAEGHVGPAPATDGWADRA